MVFTGAAPFSCFQIKLDPGIPIVFTGFILLVFGFFAGLYGKKKYCSCQVDAKGNLAVGGLGKAEEEVFCRRIREGKETAKEAV